MKDADAVVHAVGLLFDVDSGLTQFSKLSVGPIPLLVVSRRTTASRGRRPSTPSTRRPIAYDCRSHLAHRSRLCRVPSPGHSTSPADRLSSPTSLPEWLRRYLVAKRAVEAKLTENSDKLRPVVYRPSLIWSWGKLDVLPIIPVFNLASALGVPFVDRTIRVGTLADAIVAGIAGDAEGVQRFAAMDSSLRSSRVRNATLWSYVTTHRGCVAAMASWWGAPPEWPDEPASDVCRRCRHEVRHGRVDGVAPLERHHAIDACFIVISC